MIKALPQVSLSWCLARSPSPQLIESTVLAGFDLGLISRFTFPLFYPQTNNSSQQPNQTTKNSSVPSSPPPLALDSSSSRLTDKFPPCRSPLPLTPFRLSVSVLNGEREFDINFQDGYVVTLSFSSDPMERERERERGSSLPPSLPPSLDPSLVGPDQSRLHRLALRDSARFHRLVPSPSPSHSVSSHLT